MICPSLIVSVSCLLRVPPKLIRSLMRAPALRCASPNSDASLLLCVLFPEPGAPKTKTAFVLVLGLKVRVGVKV
jgi:hypothetical protein